LLSLSAVSRSTYFKLWAITRIETVANYKAQYFRRNLNNDLPIPKPDAAIAYSN